MVTHTGQGNKVFGSPFRGCAPRQLRKVIQASSTVNCGSPGSGPQPCAVRKRTSSSCSIVYPAKILTILRPNRCEHSTMRPYLSLHKPPWSRFLVDVVFKRTINKRNITVTNRWHLESWTSNLIAPTTVFLSPLSHYLTWKMGEINSFYRWLISTQMITTFHKNLGIAF